MNKLNDFSSGKSTLLIIISLILNGQIHAMELPANHLENVFLLKEKSVSWPMDTVKKSFKSGLPNTVSLVVKMFSKDKLVKHSVIEYRVIYDLWDEVYVVDILEAGESKQMRFSDTSVLLDAIGNSSIAIEETEQVDEVSVQLILNPIQSERILKIRKWIAKSNGRDFDPTSTSSSQSDLDNVDTASIESSIKSNVGVPLASKPKFEKLFDKLLNEYTKTDMPALWKSEIFKMKIKSN